MGFVGPRPIRKYFADLLAKEFPFYRLRFAVKPGFNGWAQVKGDYAGSMEGQLQKLEYELFYIQNKMMPRVKYLFTHFSSRLFWVVFDKFLIVCRSTE
jgi:lipopolysaccharide/colanic/teichoic acid biosynthesis glycosyltransferase